MSRELPLGWIALRKNRSGEEHLVYVDAARITGIFPVLAWSVDNQRTRILLDSGEDFYVLDSVDDVLNELILNERLKSSNEPV